MASCGKQPVELLLDCDRICGPRGKYANDHQGLRHVGSRTTTMLPNAAPDICRLTYFDQRVPGSFVDGLLQVPTIRERIDARLAVKVPGIDVSVVTALRLLDGGLRESELAECLLRECQIADQQLGRGRTDLSAIALHEGSNCRSYLRLQGSPGGDFAVQDRVDPRPIPVNKSDRRDIESVGDLLWAEPFEQVEPVDIAKSRFIFLEQPRDLLPRCRLDCDPGGRFSIEIVRVLLERDVHRAVVHRNLHCAISHSHPSFLSHEQPSLRARSTGVLAHIAKRLPREVTAATRRVIDARLVGRGREAELEGRMDGIMVVGLAVLFRLRTALVGSPSDPWSRARRHPERQSRRQRINVSAPHGMIVLGSDREDAR